MFVTAQLKSNHIYYGKAPKSTLQNYAITKQYEESKSELQENYSKKAQQVNVKETKVQPEVQQQKTKLTKTLPKTGM